MKGCEVYLSNQKFTSYELTYENPLKILVSLFVLYIFAFVWFFSFFFFVFLKNYFWFWVWESDHMFKSQRNQENERLLKYLCIPAGAVDEEVDDQSSVSPVKLCSFGSAVHMWLQRHRASVSIHSFLARRSRPSERKWMYPSGCIASQVMGQKVLNNSAVNPVLK